MSINGNVGFHSYSLCYVGLVYHKYRSQATVMLRPGPLRGVPLAVRLRCHQEMLLKGHEEILFCPEARLGGDRLDRIVRGHQEFRGPFQPNLPQIGLG